MGDFDIYVRDPFRAQQSYTDNQTQHILFKCATEDKSVLLVPYRSGVVVKLVLSLVLDEVGEDSFGHVPRAGHLGELRLGRFITKETQRTNRDRGSVQTAGCCTPCTIYLMAVPTAAAVARPARAAAAGSVGWLTRRMAPSERTVQ